MTLTIDDILCPSDVDFFNHLTVQLRKESLIASAEVVS